MGVYKRFFKRLWRYWLVFAVAAGWLNTRILLALMFYLVLSPMGLVMRLARADLLDQRLHKDGSYWYTKKQPELDIHYFIRQY
ncbi:hypothetical protein JW905_06865 [bacterium]|nr:hypothetical protein [candidate division CSSED10-310 bacterium]